VIRGHADVVSTVTADLGLDLVKSEAIRWSASVTVSDNGLRRGSTVGRSTSAAISPDYLPG
jgi:hypothetical protein